MFSKRHETEGILVPRNFSVDPGVSWRHANNNFEEKRIISLFFFFFFNTSETTNEIRRRTEIKDRLIKGRSSRIDMFLFFFFFFFLNTENFEGKNGVC